MTTVMVVVIIARLNSMKIQIPQFEFDSVTLTVVFVGPRLQMENYPSRKEDLMVLFYLQFFKKVILYLQLNLWKVLLYGTLSKNGKGKTLGCKQQYYGNGQYISGNSQQLFSQGIPIDNICRVLMGH